MNGFIQSFTGNAVTPLHLEPAQVRLEDIAHSLAQKTRFNGHLREFYSVAQHCVLGAQNIARNADSDARELIRVKLAFLLHEASEVYLPDVPAPIKPFLYVAYVSDVIGTKEGLAKVTTTKAWKDLEDEHAEAVFGALGLSGILPLLDCPEVKAMDRSMLQTEKRDLRSVPETDPRVIEQERLRYSGEVVPSLKIDRCWAPPEAEERFTELYHTYRSILA